jgi:hypothetical protein
MNPEILPEGRTDSSDPTDPTDPSDRAIRDPQSAIE